MNTVADADSILLEPSEPDIPAGSSPVSTVSSRRAAPFVPLLRLIVLPSIVIELVASVSRVASDFIVIASPDLIFRVVPDFAENIPEVVDKLKLLLAAKSTLPVNDVVKILLRTDKSEVPFTCLVSFPPTIVSTSSPCLPLVAPEILYA